MYISFLVITDRLFFIMIIFDKFSYFYNLERWENFLGEIRYYLWKFEVSGTSFWRTLHWIITSLLQTKIGAIVFATPLASHLPFIAEFPWKSLWPFYSMLVYCPSFAPVLGIFREFGVMRLSLQWPSWGGGVCPPPGQTRVKILPCLNYVADGKNNS